MKTYVVKTLEKKNVLNVEHWENEDRGFIIEEMFRWGEATIEVDDDFDPDDWAEGDYEEGFPVSEFTIVDMNNDDGCSMYFTPKEGDEYKELTEEQIDEMWEYNQYQSFEDAGYTIEDVDTIFLGPLEFTEVK